MLPTQQTQPLVSLARVSVERSGTRVLHDIDWTLEPGAHWAVLGANGAGKSTFLRLVRGEIWPAAVNGGRRVYGFEGELTESPIGIKQKIALVSAEQQTRYMRTDWHMLVWQIVLTGLTDSDLIYQHPTPQQLDAVDAVLAELDISALRNKDFHKLSQGQLRKVLIARALVRKPPVLICDEIGVGLDTQTRHSLFDVIARAAAGGTQILMTSHRQAELLPTLTQTALLENGRLTIQPRVAGAPQTNDTASVAAVPLQRAAPHVDGDTFVLDIRNATVALEEGATVVLRDVTWRMNAGEHWMLLGDNGAGKTTLLKLIMGDLWPAHGGSIDRFGVRDFRDVWEIKRRIGYVSHELQARYHHDLTARQVIGTGFNASVGWLSTLSAAQHARVDAILAQLAIADLAERSLQQMSYGQARKVLVGRALVHVPALLILDEVFDGLDAHFRAELSALFEQLSTTTSIILVSHHEADALPCITHMLSIDGGRVQP
jgi:molybdate transport system ATP-binding protein